MDKKEFLDRLRSRNLTRRDVNKVLAAAGVGVMSLPLMPGRASAADEALYFTWSGYEIPELQPSYVERHGTVSDSRRFRKYGPVSSPTSSTPAARWCRSGTMPV
jgi:spermidine/putrescine transport system substrate-binding protein